MLLIAGCFVAVALGVSAVVVVTRYYASQATRQTATLTGQFLPGLVSLSRLQQATLNLKSITLQLALAKDETAMNAQKQAFQTETKQIAQNIGENFPGDLGMAFVLADLKGIQVKAD